MRAKKPARSFLKILEEKVVTARPDVTFLIDVEVALGRERLKKRGHTNHMDERDLAFHEKVRFGFLSIAKENPKRVIIIDGNRSEDEIFDHIKGIIF